MSPPLTTIIPSSTARFQRDVTSLAEKQVSWTGIFVAHVDRNYLLNLVSASAFTFDHEYVYCTGAKEPQVSAVAFFLNCLYFGEGHELLSLGAVLLLDGAMQPDPDVIAMADEVLGRKGQMVAALQALPELRKRVSGSTRWL